MPLLAGIVLGNRLLRRVPSERLRPAVFIFLLVLGAKYLLTT